MSESLSNDSTKRRPGRPKGKATISEPKKVALSPEEISELTKPQSVPVFDEQAPPQPATLPGRIVNTQVVHQMSSEVHDERLRMAGEIQELETNVAYCKAAGIEWLEVSKALLMHFSKGEMPACGYFIYKDIKLCLTGTAEDIARRDGMTCHEVLFKDEKYMKVR